MAEELQSLLIRIGADITQAMRGLEEIQRYLGGFERRAEKSANKVSMAFSRMARTMSAQFAGIFAVSRLGSEYVQTERMIERLEVRLKFLTGSEREAAKAKDYLFGAARRLRVGIEDLGDGYARLQALQKGGLITEEEKIKILEGLTNATRALGGDSNKLGLVLYGLGQALSQGTVQAQEFNQIIEPLPGLMQDLDRAAGMSAGGLRQAMKAGQVTSTMLKDVLIKALEDYASVADETAGTVDDAFARMKRAWQSFVDTVRGLTAPLVSSFAAILEQVTALAEKLAEVGRDFKTTFKMSNLFATDGQKLTNGADRMVLLQDKIERLTNEKMSNPVLFTLKGGESELRGAWAEIHRLEKERGEILGRLNDISNRTDIDLEQFAEDYQVGLNEFTAQLWRRLENLSDIQLSEAPSFPGGGDRAEPITPDVSPGGPYDRVDAYYNFMESADKNRKQLSKILSEMRSDAQRALGGIGAQIHTNYTQEIEELEDRLTDLGASQEEIWEATALHIQARAGEMKQALESIKDSVDENDVAWENWLHSISDGFADAILKADSLGDVLKGLLVQLAKSELSNLFYSALGGTGKTGSILKGAGKLLGFAEGGSPPVGVPSIVGERGPELFVPKTAGTIIPNHKMGGTSITIQQTIAPNFSGNAATKQDLLQMGAIARKAAIDGVMEILPRLGPARVFA